MILFIITPVLLLLCRWMYLKITNNLNVRKCSSVNNLKGKTAIVTGATSGIGKETARDFAKRYARVLLVCRNIDKARKLREELIRNTGNNNIACYVMNLSSLSSVRLCAAEILKNEDRLDILVNNAGCAGFGSKILTEDNLELTMSINYYSNFLFTNMLLNLLRSSQPSRIINVSSRRHDRLNILNVNDLNFEKSHCSQQISYGQSKLCLNLYSVELARRMKNAGVTVNYLHPGFVATNMFADISWSSFSNLYIRLTAPFYALTPKNGAQTSIYLSVSDEVEGVTGKYFIDCREAEPTKLSNDLHLAENLWAMTEIHVGMKEDQYRFSHH